MYPCGICPLSLDFCRCLKEDHYESIELLVRVREDGQSWFDLISDLISSDCEENPTGGCTCGLESMGGTQGTLDQCYDHMRVSEQWATVRTEDLKILLGVVANYLDIDHLEIKDSYDRLKGEAYWHDTFNDWLASLPEDDDEEHNTGLWDQI